MRAPSKKVSIVMLVVVLIVVLIIVFSGIEKRDQLVKNESLNISVDLNKDLRIDSDADGLADWEEVLWGTKSDDTDTDNDGTSDSEEIKLNRNPTKPAPGDENYNFEDKVLASVDTASVDGTVTNAVVASLINNYLLLKQKGQLDATSKKNLIDSMFSEIVKSVDVGPEYKVYDLTTFNSDIDQQKLLAYGQQLASIQQNFSLNLDIASLPGGDNKSIPGLISRTSTQIAAMEVPEKLIVDHLTLANNFYRYGVAVDIIVNERPNDPVLTLVGLLLFTEIGEQIKQNHFNIYAFLETNGIIYDNTVGTFKKVNNE